MIKRIFGTFKRFINHDNGTRTIVFNKLVDDFGREIKGERFINNAMVISCMNLKFGDRYMIKYGSVKEGILLDICQTKKVYKNPRCDIFRRFKDEYHIISGRYQGKKHHQLDREDLRKYCLWLGQNTDNEMTIKNVLGILNTIAT
jgi:hypothetical protein